MALDSLGYFGVRTRNLDDWSRFGEQFLGLQLVDRSRKSLTFRMDDRRQRIVVHEDDVNSGERAAFMGWEVAGPEALDEHGRHARSDGRSRAARLAGDGRRAARQ